MVMTWQDDKDDDVALMDTWHDMSRQSGDMADGVSIDVVLSSIYVARVLHARVCPASGGV